jgi:hypothetical protein
VAGRRWLISLAALAALIWLGYFAGIVRNPGGVKRPWAVVASRAMAAVGGIIVIRLLLLPHEERVPVFYIRTGRVSREAIAGWIRGFRGREERVVPLSDVTAFMAERRYVPKGGLGIVLEAGSVAEAESLASITGDLEVTIVLPAEAFEKAARDRERLPGPVAIGALVGSGPKPADDPMAALKRFAEAARSRLGRDPVCAAIGEGGSVGPETLAGSGRYSCCLGGSGFNRFGDKPYIIRTMDITPVICLGRLTSLNTLLYGRFFKGSYIWWPVAAILRIVRATPGWR